MPQNSIGVRLGKFKSKITNFFGRKLPEASSRYADAFYSWFSSAYTSYDADDKTYLDEGFNSNGDVYAILQQMGTKVASVPFFVKRVKNKNSLKKLRAMDMATKGADLHPVQYLERKTLEREAFEEVLLELPLDRPNPQQTWEEFFSLGKVMLRMFGNAYWYNESPDLGPNQGVPKRCYWLPPQWTTIILRRKDSIDIDADPIAGYIMREGGKFAEFNSEDVIHFKLPNPNFDMNGSQLYGHSPLRAVLDNIQSSNEAMANNIKMLKNSGAFGLIHGKAEGLEEPQAKALKERLVEMDNSTERLGRIAGYSKELGFIKLSLTTEEMQPFEYLKYDQKQICNALGWSDKLLNNDDGGKYDNVKQFRKEVITGNIKPDFMIFEAGIKEDFLPRFKGYEGAVWEWDINLLPEMQQDMKELVKWLDDLVDRGIYNRNQVLEALGMPTSDDPEMNVRTVSMNLIPLSVAVMNTEPILPGIDIDED